MKKQLYILLFCCATFFSAKAQLEPSPINLKDERGKPNGLWYTFIPADKGEPAQSIMGNYDHGQKNGIWYISDGQGNMIAIESYKHDVRDGEVKYFEQGQLTCVGHYRGLNPKVAFDTVLIVDPISGDEKLVSVPTERGSIKHGSWRFYDPISGRLIKEEEYQVDALIFKKEFSISPADSSYYLMRNRLLPHNANRLPPPSKFKPKAPTKSLISG
jgi:hypothetical protein